MTRLQDIQRQIRNLQAEERLIVIQQMPALAKAREAAAKARRAERAPAGKAG